VVVDAVQHPSGKDYLRVGARLTNDFNGESTYDLSLSYTVPAIGRLNAEWRTQVVFGQTMALQTEWYQPLDPAARFFVKPSVFIGERTVNMFQNAEKIAEVRVGEFRGQLAGGINVSNDLSLAIGYEGGAGWAREKTGTGTVPKDNFETGRLFAGLAYDTMDTLNFPHEGQFVVMKYVWSDRALGADSEFQGFQGTASAAFSFGRNTFLVTGSANLSWDGALDAANVYELGGPLRLSGLPDKAISGSEALLARVVYYRELASFGPSILNMPLYAGASLEYGGVFDSIDAIDWDGMKVGGSVFIGMDTVLGPLLLGVGFTEGGHEAVFLTMGSFF
jgi:NTE family protein